MGTAWEQSYKIPVVYCGILIQHVPKEIRKLYNKLVPKILINCGVTFVNIYACVESMFPTKVLEIFLRIALVGYFLSFAWNGMCRKKFPQKCRKISHGGTNLTTVLALSRRVLGSILHMSMTKVKTVVRFVCCHDKSSGTCATVHLV